MSKKWTTVCNIQDVCLPNTCLHTIGYQYMDAKFYYMYVDLLISKQIPVTCTIFTVKPTCTLKGTSI